MDGAAVKALIYTILNQQLNGGIGWTTTDATPTNVYEFFPEPKSAGLFTVSIAAVDQDLQTLTAIKRVPWRSDADGVVTLGTIADVHSVLSGYFLGAWTIATDGDKVYVELTGVASKTIDWTFKIIDKLSTVSSYEPVV